MSDLNKSFNRNNFNFTTFEKKNFFFDYTLFHFLQKMKKKLYFKKILLLRFLNLYTDNIKFNLKYVFFKDDFDIIILNFFLNRVEIFFKFYNISLIEFTYLIPNILNESVLTIPKFCNFTVVRESLFFTRDFDFEPKDHINLFPELYSMFSMSTVLKISGPRFPLLYGHLAKLHRSLGQFMLDIHINKHHYTEIYVPLLVKEKSLIHSGQLPKFFFDQYKVSDEDLWLIPTGEVPLVNLVSNMVFEEIVLPLKFVCLSQCFRKETGNSNKEVKGLYRQHQFEKVELVQVTKPVDSYNLLEKLVVDACFVLDCLKVPYRVILLAGHDTGFTSAKTYDIEVWLPGKKSFQEVSSCSNTENFQARRMNTKFLSKNGSFDFVHILNGSGLAVGRVLIAIMENYQDKDGNILIPDVLKTYMGIDKIII